MPLRISTNTQALNAQRGIAKSQRQIADRSAQLSSGHRITRSADDAAGLSISENLRGQVRGLHQAQRNANDAVSVLQTAEGGLSEVSNILGRMHELGVQASSDTIGQTERGLIQGEIHQLKQEVDRISATTRYGGQTLLDGSAIDFEFQVDTVANTDGIINFNAQSFASTTASLDIDDFDFSDKNNARNALARLESSQHKVNGFRSDIGALQNRLASANNNLGTSIENVSETNSQIRDADIAESTAEITKHQILLNAATSMASQAHQSHSLALQLL